MVDISTLSANAAYRNQLRMLEEAGAAVPQPQDEGKPSFSKLMESAVQDGIDAQYKAEAVQMQSLTGKVELSDLVTAVANADLTLNTVVAIRDRVISAYEDIIKMPI